jgi:hypothetical protein
MARTVTNKIKELLKARDAKILSGTEYVQGLLADVRKEILAELASTPVDSYSAFYMRQSLASIEQHLSAFESAADRELGAVISSTWAMGAELLPAVAQAAGGVSIDLGVSHLSANTIETLKEFTFGRIKSVSGDLFTKIKGELTMGILGQKTPQEIAGILAGSIADLPIPKNKWGHPLFKSAAERAEVITGLETGRAFSIATQKSLEQASDTLPGLKKMWLHAGHPRTPRQTHLLMHGQVRGPGKAFYDTVGGGQVMYPRDPNAPIGEVIRCGCTHIPFMEEWGSADNWAESFMTAQDKANRREAA